MNHFLRDLWAHIFFQEILEASLVSLVVYLLIGSRFFGMAKMIYLKFQISKKHRLFMASSRLLEKRHAPRSSSSNRWPRVLQVVEWFVGWVVTRWFRVLGWLQVCKKQKETEWYQPGSPKNRRFLVDGNGETPIFHVKIRNHQIETTILKWMFRVPGKNATPAEN